MRGMGDKLTLSLRALASAVQFLTRFQVPARFQPSEDDLRRSVVFFPVAGFGIGLTLFAAFLLLENTVPPLVGGVLLTIVWVWMTGGLHMDGLMDTVDGVLSYRSRERMLEIMKDSRVGAMGAIAGMLALLLRVALLTSLLQLPFGAIAAGLPVLVAPVWSRAFLPTAMTGWPYVRAEGEGFGGLYRGLSRKHAVGAVIAAFVITFAATAIGGNGLDFAATAIGANGHDDMKLFDETRESIWPSPLAFLSQTTAISAAATAIIVTAMAALVAFIVGWAAARSVARRLGGLTGDVYGAINEMIELGLLFVAVVWLYRA